MVKTVSADEVLNQLDSVLGYVSDQGDEVIVESHGEPKAVIMSLTAYDDVKAMREERRRAELLEDFHRLNDRIAAHQHDLSEDEAIELSVEISREINNDLAARSEAGFKRGQI